MNHRHLYRLQRSSWQPARLIDADVVLACYALGAQAIFRSWDYSTGQESAPGPNPGLSLVEQAFPLWAWSLAFAIGAGVLMVGVKQKRHAVVWAGHRVLMGTYVALGVGIAIPAFSHPFMDGIRSATVLIAPGVMHWLFSRRMGPKPTRRAMAVETVGEAV